MTEPALNVSVSVRLPMESLEAMPTDVATAILLGVAEVLAAARGSPNQGTVKDSATPVATRPSPPCP
jgi:hypothetical protein